MDADIRKTTLRMIPDALYVLTAAEGDSVGSATINWVSQIVVRARAELRRTAPRPGVRRRQLLHEAPWCTECQTRSLVT